VRWSVAGDCHGRALVGLRDGRVVCLAKLRACAMKEYTVEIEIALPRHRVIELFDNPNNLVRWQTGLQSVEHISGEPGQREGGR
jgi:hypothetical protein